MLTNEELLKPRWKVIALWPNTDFKVGQIVTNEYEVQSATDFYNQYPHLFSPLPWWADRKPEDMPEYVKRGCVVFKVQRWLLGSYSFTTDKGAHPIGSCLEPATETDYLTCLF